MYGQGKRMEAFSPLAGGVTKKQVFLDGDTIAEPLFNHQVQKWDCLNASFENEILSMPSWEATVRGALHIAYFSLNCEEDRISCESLLNVVV
jgi:hypothetical protein